MALKNVTELLDGRTVREASERVHWSCFIRQSAYAVAVQEIVCPSIYLYLFICLSLYKSACLSICLSLYKSACLSVCLSICLSLSLYVYHFVCLSVSLSTCLPLCLSVYMSTCIPLFLSICLPFCLSVYLSTSLPVCLSTCLHLCLSVYLSTSLSVYLPTFLSVCLSVYLSTSLSICLHFCLSVCLLVYLCLSVCLSVYLSVFLCVCQPAFCLKISPSKSKQITHSSYTASCYLIYPETIALSDLANCTTVISWPCTCITCLLLLMLPSRFKLSDLHPRFIIRPYVSPRQIMQFSVNRQ